MISAVRSLAACAVSDGIPCGSLAFVLGAKSNPEAEFHPLDMIDDGMICLWVRMCSDRDLGDVPVDLFGIGFLPICA